VLPRKNLEQAEDLIVRLEAVLKAEIAAVDPGLSVVLETLPGKRVKVLKKVQQRKILQTLTSLPHGVIKMSAEIPGLVETSPIWQ